MASTGAGPVLVGCRGQMSRKTERRRSLSRRLTVLLAALALLLGACGEPQRRGPTPLIGPVVTPATTSPPGLPGGGRPFRFAAGSANVLRTHREIGPLLRYLTASTGLGFELVYCHSYPELMQSIEQRTCDFGWLGAQAYLRVRKATGCEPIVQFLETGKASYAAVVVVAAKAPFRTLEELRGKRLALVSRNSTSGHVYPMAFFRSKGLEPQTFFSRLTHEGSHEAALLSVIRGLADVACVGEPEFRAFGRSQDLSGLRILARTPEIPNGPIVAQTTVPLEIRRQVAAALLGLDSSPAGRRLLEGLRAGSELSGFGPVTDATYDEARRIIALAREGGKD